MSVICMLVTLPIGTQITILQQTKYMYCCKGAMESLMHVNVKCMHVCMYMHLHYTYKYYCVFIYL